MDFALNFTFISVLVKACGNNVKATLCCPEDGGNMSPNANPPGDVRYDYKQLNFLF